MNKVLKTAIFLSLLIFYPVHSQCIDSIKVEFADGSFGDYTGCLDDSKRPSGKGILKTKKYQQEGNWESGRLNGKGKITVFKDNSIKL